MTNRLLINAAQFVISYYDEPHRYYHSIDHINALFETQNELNLTLTPDQILAIYFHDIVYLPGTPLGFNEDQSVKLLRVFAKHNPGLIDDDSLKIAGNIILDTIDHIATIEESEIVLDLDLHCLSSSWEDYVQSTAKVRAEHILVNDEDFRTGRIDFLTHMLKHDRIYHTELFYDKFEKQARRNLQNDLDTL